MIIDKAINKINVPLDKLNEAINITKEFLDATSQKQAAELLPLQESLAVHSSLVKSLADAAKTFAQSSNPRGLANMAWPPLVGANPLAPCQGNLVPPPDSQR